MEITFPEECTVEAMAGIQSTLLNALRQGGPATLSFRQVARADLSFFQLLHIAEKSFRQARQELTLLPDLSPGLAFKAMATNWSRLVAPVAATPPAPSPTDPC